MKNNFKRVMTLLMALIMILGVMPMTVIAEETTGSVTNYTDFMTNLKVLEGYAAEYASAIHGKDAGELVLNFIRTGVERYQDDNWNTLAGVENTGFTGYVKAQDAEKGTTAMSLKDIVVEDFVLPNGNPADFGHMFGCMNISYVAPGSADLSGWAGDVCDLLQYSVSMLNKIPGYATGDVETMAEYIQEYCFGVNASGAYGWDDFYGDMDAYYLISEYKKANGTKKFSEIMENYFNGTLSDVDADAKLSDVDRTVYFMNNRFAVADSQDAVRKAIYEAYTADVGLKILESKRGLSSYNALRQACCYAFADYVYSQAKGKLIEGTVSDGGPANGYYTVFSNEHSILAPGVEQDINYAQTADGKQIVYYVATVDIQRSDLDLMVNYNNNLPPVDGQNIGLQRVEDQVAALVKNNLDKENFHPIVSTNGAGYNITTGYPAGLVVMNGVEYNPIGGTGFFAILKDGTAMIGDEAKYAEMKAAGQVKEAIQAFGAILVKDGKINVTKSANYTSSRASRTAIGITAEGKVVMMVLDGRQLPRSAGGAMEEIAQIMLEAGCVDAVNLDGGGSTTYMSKPAGSDSIRVVNTPSDGYARSVSTSLVVVSTAAPSTAFDHAVISSDYEYITAGTSMQFSVTGVSNTGNAAEVPAGSTWVTSDPSIGTINASGLFTAVANGTVKVQYVLSDGTVVGEKTINVVVPDDIKFVEDRITAVYGVPKEIAVTVWYQGNPVAFTPLREAAVFFDYEFDQYGNPKLYFTSDAGNINGFEFVGSDAKGVRTATIYAALMIGKNIIARMASVSLYYPDEATFDFENADQGNRKLAWNREIENAKTLDNMLYRISDPESPVTIDYTFALDMTAIDFPVQLEPLKSMLPTYQEGATAWTYMLQLAERVCTQTNVTITAEFSKELDVDISGLKVINDYFKLTDVRLSPDNVLTMKCNWVNQSKPIDAATANPLCILAGITATVKDTAAWFNNEITIANNGYVSYDIYLAASSLYSFAQDSSNQSQYGLYPYIHAEDCRSDFTTEDPGMGNGDSTGSGDAVVDPDVTNNDKGARFSSQYIDFADIYVMNSENRQGWHEENNSYYYYVNNEPLTGIQIVPDRLNKDQRRVYLFAADGKLVNERGESGLQRIDGDLYYAVQGVIQTGWQQPHMDDPTKNYYFHPDTGKAVDGEYKIRENANSWTVNEYTYHFVDHVLVRGDKVYETESGVSGWRYRWAGAWAYGWFDIDGEAHYAKEYAPHFMSTGFVSTPVRGTPNWELHLFDSEGVFQGDYTGPYTSGSSTFFLVNGVKARGQRLYQANDGHLYFTNPDNATIYKNHTEWIEEQESNGLVPVGSYKFDEQGRMVNSLVTLPKAEQTPDGVTATAQGGSITVTAASDTPACRVGYIGADGKYVVIEASKNADGTYTFAAEAHGKTNVSVAIVVAGDTDGDGKVETEDVTALQQDMLGKKDAGATGKLAGDINGDGKLTIADIVLLNAASKGKTDIKW